MAQPVGSRDLSRTLRRRIADTPSVSFYSEFPLDAQFRLPADFSVAKYAGLLLCHVAETGATRKLIAYWASSDHYRVGSSRLADDLALNGQCSGGLVADLVAGRENWLTRVVAHFSAKELVVGAAAVLGAIAVLRGSIAQVFDPPDLKVTFVDSEPVRVVPGLAWSAPVKVVNTSAYSPSRILGIRGTATPKGGSKAVPLQLTCLAAF
jgi:hypothetical protein